MKFDPTLYLVTDSSLYEEDAFLTVIDGVCAAGITLLQLREKERSTREYLRLANAVRQITDRYGIPLILDDRADVAAACGCAGVHVGQEDLPVQDARRILGQDRIVGATAKTVEQARIAFQQGADYLGCGAVYPTTTKVRTVLTPVETIRQICQSVPIPVNAIGGLNRGNLEVLRGVPIRGICVVSAIMKAADPAMETRLLKEAVRELLEDASCAAH